MIKNNILTKEKTDKEQFNSIHKIFEEQVERSPDKIALICGNQKLTYRELNTRANQLARHLQTQGVKPETLIGLYMERSLDIIISILGILKAGGAYVPLDPKYPQERIAFIVAETQLSRLLTQEHLVKELPQLDAEIVCIDQAWEDISPESQENPISETTLENLAYLIFTSGSTGKPKGVEIPHGNISNYVQSMSQAFNLNSKDTYLHTASFSFSSSVRQLMVPLSQGATVVIAATKEIQSPLTLFELIKQSGVTVIDVVPSYWRSCTELLEQIGTEKRNTILDNQLRLIVSASEPLLTDIPRKWRWEFNQDIEFINMYGQTETTGIVCVYPIPDEYEDEVKIVPIGRPIANTEIYVLDEHQSPVPVGEIGELYISGSSLARSYFNRPDLTEEKFIPNPFSNDPKSRLYKGGDLVRLLPNGTIKFVGRSDYQVKIRGQRVELGEIESIIALYPGVKQTIVMGKDISGDQRLVAYIVPRTSSHEETNQTVSIKQLKNYLKEKLPEYMVPSAFVILPAFPLTPTGKIDRRALPTPENLREQVEETFVAPRNELEIKLTKIWEKVLGVQPIGIRDNFFELGGHSLLAVRLFNEIEKTWGQNLPISTLFQAQTIEDMASFLSQKESPAHWSSLVVIQPGRSKPPLFFIHPIGGNILEYYDLVNYLGTDHPIYGLQSQGLDGIEEPLSRVEDMANHYIKEIRFIQPNGPYFFIGYSFGGLVAYEIAQQLHLQGQKVALLALLDVRSPNLVEHKSSFTKFVRVHLSNLGQLDTQGKWRYINDWVKWQLNKGNYKDFIVNQLSEPLKHAKVIDSNFQAYKNYIPDFYPGLGLVALFRSCLQTVKFADHRDLGWGSLVEKNLEIYDIPGDHYSVLREPVLHVVAEKLKLCLEKAYKDTLPGTI